MPDRLLSRHARTSAVAYGPDGERTLDDLLRAASAYAAGLDGRVPLLLVDDRYRFAAALLAAWSRGLTVDLPPNAQPATLEELAEGRQVLTDRDGFDARLTGALDLRTLEKGSPDPLPWKAPDPDTPVVTIFTSGTTGGPQRFVKSAGQLLGEASVLAAQFGVGPRARLVATVPAHHIYGLLFAVLVPLAGGAAFLRDTPLLAEDVARAVVRYEADFLVSVPAHLRTLLGVSPMPRDLRVLSSSAQLPPELGHELVERHGFPVTEVLGSTETGGIAWRDADGDGLWRPLPGVSVIADPEGRMLVDSAFLPIDAPRPFPAEDRVELEGPGFRHLGRLDDVVKVGGKRVSLSAVAEALLAEPGVEDVALTAREVDGVRGSELVGLVVAPSRSGQALRDALAQRFDPVVVPRILRHVDALPRDERGKVPREVVVATCGEPRTDAYELETLHRKDEPTPLGERSFLRVGIPVRSRWFQGHFPGRPVLPGAALLEFAEVQARETWSKLGPLRRVKRLKFRQPVLPGEELGLRLERASDDNLVEFEFTRAGVQVSRGSLLFDVGGPGVGS